LDTAETLKRFRSFWFPTLLDRRTRLPWLQSGGTTLGQRLTARVLETVREHQVKPLEPDRKQKVQEILAQASG